MNLARLPALRVVRQWLLDAVADAEERERKCFAKILALAEIRRKREEAGLKKKEEEEEEAEKACSRDRSLDVDEYDHKSNAKKLAKALARLDPSGPSSSRASSRACSIQRCPHCRR